MPAEHVVDDDRDAYLAAGLDDVGDVGLERRVAALVLGNLRLVDPDDRAVRRGVEAQHDPLATPSLRDARHGLVPGVADVVVYLGLREHVVVARRNRHLPRPRERLLPPALGPTLALRIESEAPEPVE